MFRSKRETHKKTPACGGDSSVSEWIWKERNKKIFWWQCKIQSSHQISNDGDDDDVWRKNIKRAYTCIEKKNVFGLIVLCKIDLNYFLFSFLLLFSHSVWIDVKRGVNWVGRLLARLQKHNELDFRPFCCITLIPECIHLWKESEREKEKFSIKFSMQRKIALSHSISFVLCIYIHKAISRWMYIRKFKASRVFHIKPCLCSLMFTIYIHE